MQPAGTDVDAAPEDLVLRVDRGRNTEELRRNGSGLCRGVQFFFLLRVAVLLVLMLVAVATSLLAMDRLGRDAHTLQQQALPRFLTASRLSQDALTLTTLTLAVAGARAESEQQTLQDRIADRAGLVLRHLDDLRGLGLEPARLERLEKDCQAVLEGAEALMGARRAELRLTQAGGRPDVLLEERRYNLGLRQERLAQAFATTVSQLSNELEAELRAQQEVGAELRARLQLAVALTSVALLFGALWVVVAVRRRLVLRLRRLGQVMGHWQRTGRPDLLPEIHTASARRDEIDALAEVLVTLMAQIEHRTQRLEHQAGTDPLTGLQNRRRFEQRAEQVLTRSLETGRPVALLALDLDRFKAINDHFGHAAGDEVLSVLAHLLRRSLRDEDLAARSGGEEFLVLLPETASEPAVTIAERIRMAMGQHRFSFDPEQPPLQVTVSLGVACLQTGDTLPAFIERADQLLYAAKRAGRDRVVAQAWGGEPVPADEGLTDPSG